jgi:hypothetical protein
MKQALLSLVFLLGFSLAAQVDSLAKPSFSTLSQFFNPLKLYTIKEDTVLDFQFNYSAKSVTGNLSLPSRELLIDQHSLNELGIRFITPSYLSQSAEDVEIKFYKTEKPYTKVFGLVGQRQEQILRLHHTGNLKSLNYSLQVNRSKCNGFYKQQLATGETFIGSFNYDKNSSLYFLSGWMLKNQIKHQENGGISTFLNFDSLYKENKELLSIQLEEAKRVTRQINTGILHGIKIRSKSDTNSTQPKLFHQFNFKRESFVFTDENPSPSYYEEIYLDSTVTRDSSSSQHFINRFGIISQINPTLPILVEFSYKNEFSTISQFATLSNSPTSTYFKNFYDTNYINHSAQAKFYANFKNISAIIFSDYGISGFNKNNFVVSTNFKWKPESNKFQMEFTLLTEQRNPNLFFYRFYANNFRWNQILNPITTSQIHVNFFLLNKKIIFEHLTRQNRNLIWFYTPDVPLQYNNTVLTSRTGIGTHLAYRNIHFQGKFNYQFTTRPEIISIPDFQFQSQVYYSRQSKTKGMRFQTGFQFTYFSAFESNAYMPGTNMFYASGRKTSGNYPFMDFFFNAEIEPVKFFLLVDHLNQGFSGSNYFLTPGLPMADRSIKFGFTWLFWD